MAGQRLGGIVQLTGKYPLFPLYRVVRAVRGLQFLCAIAKLLIRTSTSEVQQLLPL